jgi:hypothetical protein
MFNVTNVSDFNIAVAVFHPECTFYTYIPEECLLEAGQSASFKISIIEPTRQ